MKRLIALVLALVIVLSCIPLGSFAAVDVSAYDSPTIVVDSKYAAAGATVDVDICVANNPGMAGAKITVSYHKDLELVEAASGETFSALDYTRPGVFTSPCNFNWDSENAEVSEDGVLLTLSFRVADSVAANAKLNVDVSYRFGDIYNSNLDSLEFDFVNGFVTVLDYIPGDVNSDGVINGKDITLLRRFNAGGYDIVINEAAGDVNDDGVINGKDITLVRRYNAGGYDVALLPSTPRCSHVMKATSAKMASCTQNGNTAYWYCTSCQKYYSDADGTNEISLDQTVISATGHTIVIDEAVAPTYTSTGLTKGSHCSICGMVLVPQEEIPMLEINTYRIEYHFTDSDLYLQGLVDSGTLVNKNPLTYADQDVIYLQNLSVPGYTFEGWFDGPWSDANRVTKISNRRGDITLYAKWKKITYKVTFDSPDVPVESITYTVDTGATLKNPTHFGYTFVGWSLNSKIVSAIPVGTVGNLTLHANWTSDRNKAVAVAKYDDPIIVEDMVGGQYLFIFEIGTIQNVPLALIKDLGNTEGISLSQSYTYTQQVNEKFAETIARTVTNATTTTSAWTLSEDWNDISSATTELGEEIGKTKETTDSQGNVVEGKYYVSNVKGGSTTSSSSAGGSSGTSSKVTEGNSTGINGSYTTESTDSSSTELGISASLSGSAQVGPAAARYTVSAEISGSENQTTSSTDMESRTTAASRSNSFTNEGNSSNENHWDTSNTASSSWNTTESYESASATSTSTEVSNAISELIYSKYGYSSTIERGGENSKTASTGESTQNTKEYSSTVEYSYGEEKSYTETVTRQSSATGYYRLVSAGTVHVFAVVGYNIATNSYYTYTYNVLDTERHVYLDYSKDNAGFNDCENAILPFEVPYDVHEYISSIIYRSNGLRINEATGVIEAYSGNAEYVVIPEYISVSDGVAEPYAVRVTGISANAFAGNTNIKGVYLPKYVSEIPDRAFAGCDSLKVVMGYGVSKIGAHAFDGCVKLNSFAIDKHITALGENAFVGVPEVKVDAANEAVADATIKSGATRITLDITKLGAYDNRVIEISSNTQYFAIIGNSYNGSALTGATYKNLCIESDAKETFISNMIFEDNKNTPLTIDSKKVTLSRVQVKNAPGFALVMTADNVELELYGTISLSSASENATISKNITLARHDANVSGMLNLSGNYLVCGNVTNPSLMTFTQGSLKHLNATEYEAMLTSSILTFNPNGGNVDTTEKLIYYGQAYGTLPTPTRTGFDFVGWYTATSGGALVTEDTIVTVLANNTLYARWNAKAYKVSWNAGTGYSITVKRTSSPNAGVATGNLNNGATVYYGDILSVTYTRSDYYNITKHGVQSVTVTGDVTSAQIYASAEENPLSNWVKASDLPSGAKVVERKWKYILREYTTNSASSLSGWTKYDTKRTGWGATQGPVYSDPSNGTRNVWSEQYVTSSNYKTVYKYFRYSKSQYGSGGSDVPTSTYGTNYYEYVFDYALTIQSSTKGNSGVYGYKYYYNAATGNTVSGNYLTVWKCPNFTENVWVSDNYGTRWYYQEPVYTYYYYRDVAKEATSNPTGQSNVSDVVEWVRYRAK